MGSGGFHAARVHRERLGQEKPIGEERRYEGELGGTVADDDISRNAKGLRRSRIAKPILIIGLLLLITGVSGVFWFSLPQSGTALLTEDTYVRLDGRCFGHISGSYSSWSDSRDVDIDISILDQHQWDVKMGISSDYRIEEVLRSHSHHGELTEFSASLPASGAYYLYLLSVQPLPNETYLYGYDPIIRVEVHWNIWGPAFDYSLEYSASVLLGVAFVLYGDHAGLNRIGGAIYGGWKRV
jgi:hypothetical protein